MMTPLKLYRCLGHGLRMCIYHLDIILRLFLSLFNKLNLLVFMIEVNIFKVLCLGNSSFYGDFLDTLQVFRSRYEDVRIFSFLVLFHKLKLVIF